MQRCCAVQRYAVAPLQFHSHTCQECYDRTHPWLTHYAVCRVPSSQVRAVCICHQAVAMALGCASVQGTMQQLAAAAALHSLNWRFHSALKTWFQWPSSHQVTPRVGLTCELKWHRSRVFSLWEVPALACLALVALHCRPLWWDNQPACVPGAGACCIGRSMLQAISLPRRHSHAGFCHSLSRVPGCLCSFRCGVLACAVLVEPSRCCATKRTPDACVAGPDQHVRERPFPLLG